MIDDDADFLQAFHRCRLDSLSHEDHVRVAWLVLRSEPLTVALQTLSAGFRAFASAKGRPDIYHETMTWAYTLLIHERIQMDAGGESWEEFLRLHPDLAAGRPVLERFYSCERLNSQLARRTFLLPDRASGSQGDGKLASHVT